MVSGDGSAFPPCRSITFGRFEVVANFENLLDVRQTKHAPLVRPTPGTGGRWTTDVWAPLEGFMANVAVRYRW